MPSTQPAPAPLPPQVASPVSVLCLLCSVLHCFALLRSQTRVPALIPRMRPACSLLHPQSTGIDSTRLDHLEPAPSSTAASALDCTCRYPSSAHLLKPAQRIIARAVDRSRCFHLDHHPSKLARDAIAPVTTRCSSASLSAKAARCDVYDSPNIVDIVSAHSLLLALIGIHVNCRPLLAAFSCSRPAASRSSWIHCSKRTRPRSSLTAFARAFHL